MPPDDGALPVMTQLMLSGYRISAPMEVDATAYDACIQCCGKTDGITKTGSKAKEWYTVAVDPDVIPLGTKIYVPEFDRVFEAQDIGGKIRGRRMDFFLPDHNTAVTFGRRPIKAYLLARPNPTPAATPVWAPVDKQK